MSKLQSWVEVMKGKGIQVIDNTHTLDNPQPEAEIAADLPPLATRAEVDAALERAKQAREATYEIKPSKPVLVTPTVTVIPVPEATLPNPNHLSFPALAKQAEVGSKEVEVAELLPPEVVEVNTGISWTDLVASAEGQAGLPPEVSYDGETDVPDFPPEIPIVYVSIDVPEGVEVVFKLNGQELL